MRIEQRCQVYVRWDRDRKDAPAPRNGTVIGKQWMNHSRHPRFIEKAELIEGSLAYMNEVVGAYSDYQLTRKRRRTPPLSITGEKPDCSYKFILTKEEYKEMFKKPKIFSFDNNDLGVYRNRVSNRSMRRTEELINDLREVCCIAVNRVFNKALMERKGTEVVFLFPLSAEGINQAATFELLAMNLGIKA